FPVAILFPLSVCDRLFRPAMLVTRDDSRTAGMTVELSTLRSRRGDDPLTWCITRGTEAACTAGFSKFHGRSQVQGENIGGTEMKRVLVLLGFGALLALCLIVPNAPEGVPLLSRRPNTVVTFECDINGAPEGDAVK